MLPSSAGDDPDPEKREAGILTIDGRALDSAQDVARFFNVAHGTMSWVLYKAPETQRYRAFEIPKKSGGMRQIHSPVGMVREMQRRLAPILQAAYDAHPCAHGFIAARGAVTNAKGHVGQRQVLNVDLEDFFPSINFGRIRGLFMAAPFRVGPAAAAVLAQICTHRNGLPQGAPTSPALSNFIAATLDRRLTRLGKEHNLRYSRYADDITFSTNQPVFPPAVAIHRPGEGTSLNVHPGEALERAIAVSGFTINLRKVRLQSKSMRQAVTGLTVNQAVNVERKRIRRVRAMVHAWEKFGLDAAGAAHFAEHRGAGPRFGRKPGAPGPAFRNVVYGQLAYIKMVRGAGDRVFLKLCGRVLNIDPNPSKFVRAMVFGADDFDIFISHAGEDKDSVARPIFEACGRLGLKAFLDEPHIAWGENFTKKINTALGAARTVVAIVSAHSVSKDWPLAELSTALDFEVKGAKSVVPVMVGRPDLSKLPLLQGKNHIVWADNADQIARRLHTILHPPAPSRMGASSAVPPTALPSLTPAPPSWKPLPRKAAKPRRRSLLEWIFGTRR